MVAFRSEHYTKTFGALAARRVLLEASSTRLAASRRATPTSADIADRALHVDEVVAPPAASVLMYSSPSFSQTIRGPTS
jgi:hypothetical protein